MRQHEREKMVKDAEAKVSEALYDSAGDLTEGEFLRLVCAVFGNAVSTMARDMIRIERHGDADTPGGIER